MRTRGTSTRAALGTSFERSLDELYRFRHRQNLGDFGFVDVANQSLPFSANDFRVVDTIHDF